MKSSTLILAVGLVILLNAGFSMLQCKSRIDSITHKIGDMCS